VSKFCVIDDARDLCEKLNAEIVEMPEGDKRACLAQIHQWFVELTDKAEVEAEAMQSEVDEAEAEATRWEGKYDDLQDKLEEMENSLDHYREEEAEKEEEWRDDPDPYGLHGLHEQDQGEGI
jgi:hypothetical protein